MHGGGSRARLAYPRGVVYVRGHAIERPPPAERARPPRPVRRRPGARVRRGRRRWVPPSTPASPAACGPAHAGMGHEPLGLSVAQGDTTIAPTAFTVAAGRAAAAALPRRSATTAPPLRSGFEVEAERRLHLILVRRDLTGYQHLHPAMAADGTWSVPLTVARAGRLSRLRRLPARLREARARRRPARARRLRAARAAGAGADARASTATTSGSTQPALRAGREAQLRFTVSRGGRPVRGIQPYLGARGHLVALRQGDLAYLHAHPEEQRGRRGEIPFARRVPLGRAPTACSCSSAAAARVHTAAFTVEVAP